MEGGVGVVACSWKLNASTLNSTIYASQRCITCFKQRNDNFINSIIKKYAKSKTNNKSH